MMVEECLAPVMWARLPVRNACNISGGCSPHGPHLAMGCTSTVVRAAHVGPADGRDHRVQHRLGGDYNDDFELPDTESTTAQDLLGELSGTAGTGRRARGPGRLEPRVRLRSPTRRTQQAMTRSADRGLQVAGVHVRASPRSATRSGATARAAGRPGRRRSGRAQGAGQSGGVSHPRSRRPEAQPAPWRTSARPASAPTARSPTRP